MISQQKVDSVNTAVKFNNTTNRSTIHSALYRFARAGPGPTEDGPSWA